jgi:hypothetical protein
MGRNIHEIDRVYSQTCPSIVSLSKVSIWEYKQQVEKMFHSKSMSEIKKQDFNTIKYFFLPSKR